jgi:hypothetical protein
MKSISSPPSMLASLTLVLLAGCATTADVDKAKASWRGATYDEVVRAWGQPASQVTLDNGLPAYTWISQGNGGGFGSSVGVFGGSGGGGVGISMPLPGMGGTISGQCQRTLSFNEGRVVDQIWQGTTQYCTLFKR